MGCFLGGVRVCELGGEMSVFCLEVIVAGFLCPSCLFLFLSSFLFFWYSLEKDKKGWYERRLE